MCEGIQIIKMTILVPFMNIWAVSIHASVPEEGWGKDSFHMAQRLRQKFVSAQECQLQEQPQILRACAFNIEITSPEHLGNSKQGRANTWVCPIKCSLLIVVPTAIIKDLRWRFVENSAKQGLCEWFFYTCTAQVTFRHQLIHSPWWTQLVLTFYWWRNLHKIDQQSWVLRNVFEYHPGVSLVRTLRLGGHTFEYSSSWLDHLVAKGTWTLR